MEGATSGGRAAEEVDFGVGGGRFDCRIAFVVVGGCKRWKMGERHRDYLEREEKLPDADGFWITS